MAMHETRSARPAQSPDQPDLEGVGARQGDLFPGPEGGGYLNECNSSELLEGAKLRELADMGLPSIWIRVATAIGYDNFLQFWRILDTAAELREIRRSENESMIEVQLRRYTSFKRYQRNRWIESMGDHGLPPAVIQQALKEHLGEKLDKSRIRRVLKQGRMQE